MMLEKNCALSLQVQAFYSGSGYRPFDLLLVSPRSQAPTWLQYFTESKFSCISTPALLGNSPVGENAFIGYKKES